MTSDFFSTLLADGPVETVPYRNVEHRHSEARELGLLLTRDTPILIQNRYNERIEVHRAKYVLVTGDVNLIRKVINNKININSFRNR